MLIITKKDLLDNAVIFLTNAATFEVNAPECCSVSYGQFWYRHTEANTFSLCRDVFCCDD